jgi:hypothetical protein
MGKKLSLKSKAELQSTFNQDVDPLLATSEKVGNTQSIYEKTQYDKGYLPAYGDLDGYKARQQPAIDQLANAAIKTLPGVALGIVENAGYLAELLSNDQDYNNSLTEVARNSRDWLENKLPTYRENPNEVFDLKDPAWWISHGQGLVESVGEFLVTGAGVGSTLSKGAKGLTTALKAGEKGVKLGQGVAQLGTASGLAYTEGAMSGARIYKDVLEATGSVEKASDAASKTVMLNTVLNTGLNITSLSPLFKNFSQLDDAVKSGISRQAKESTGDYLKRLTLLESQGVKNASIVKKLALEAGQEGLEEDVNLFAEDQGYIEGGMRKSKGNYLDDFLNNAFSEEGALNFILGAVGGVAQTAGMEYAPLKTYIDEQGNTQRVSAHTLEGIEKQKYQKETISTLKTDIEYLRKNQEDLNTAIKNNDRVGAEVARNNLFNIAALKSIRTETSEELSKEIASIASVDNTIIRENGKTDAQNQGLADNIDDNQYKETANKKAIDLKQLNKEFRDLNAIIQDPHVASEAFRRRLDVYSLESTLADLTKASQNKELNLNVNFPINQIDATKYKAETLAYQSAILYQEAKGDKKSADLLRSESQMVTSLYNDLVKENPNLDKQLESKIGVLSPLVKDYANQLVAKQEINKAKDNYSKILNDPKKFKKEIIDPAIKELTKDKERKEKEQKEAEVKAKKQSDYKEAKLKAEEEKQQFINEENTEKVDNVIEEVQKDAEVQDKTLAVDQLSNLTPISEIYVPPTEKEKQEQENIINEQLNKQETLTTEIYGNHNKLAYKAQEQDSKGNTIDSTIINDNYKILHDNTISVGTELTLKIDTDSPFYEANKDDINTVPIGVYYKEKLVGYVPTYRGQNKQLAFARNFIFKNGEVKDTVGRKTAGVLNIGEKALVADNFAFTPDFLIGRNEQFEDSLNSIYDKEELLNKQGSRSGYLYTMTPTPDGKQIALPVDIDRVDSEVVDSLMKVFDLFFKKGKKGQESKLTEEEQQLVVKIQNEYDQDITTPQGLSWYFNQWFTGTDLSSADKGEANIERINQDLRSNNNYLELVSGGLKILSNPSVQNGQSGKPLFYGANDINNEGKRNRVIALLNNTFYRADLTKINSKREFKVPILNTKDNNVIEYKKKSYNEHLSSISRTNVIAVNIGNNKQTVFVQPTINLNFDFLKESQSKENLDFTTENEQKFVSLTTNKKSGLNTLDEFEADEFQSENPTEEESREYKDRCKT